MPPKKILIVDDDPQVHRILETVLASKSYQIMKAPDGTLAWETICTQRPDLVVLDIMMPGLSGIEVCQKIRREPELSSTLVLMLSAKDSQDDRLHGLQYGADDYVTKPFHVATLVNKIDYMLQKA